MITSKTISNGILKAIGTLALIVAAIYLIWQIQTLIYYLVAALILTLIGNPIQLFFRKKLKFSMTMATVATLFIFILIIVGLIMMFVPLVLSQSENLSVLNTSEIETNVSELLAKINNFLISHGVDKGNTIDVSKITSKLDFNFIPVFLNSVLGALSSFGMGLASTLFITFFFLKDKIMFIIGIKKILPDNHEEKILNSLSKINDLLSRYFIGLLLQLFIVFLLYWIVLLIFGIQNGFVIAFFCAVLNIIPYIGPLIGSVLAAVLTMISNLGMDFQSEILPKTIYVMIGFAVVQFIDNNFSQPIIFSKSTNSHPLEIFLVILIGGFLFGVLGMIIAVPVYTMLKVIGKEFFPENKIIRILAKNI
ncbi:AI-2E family transporter [Flavobacterium pallidum]|uniref:AI-2E family transporter n=1 Tax=Flavobacterium pallidum TaxID=2172098 RepID=A0A2S1SJ41_9FLAO|nr:AI-2E family transporter [Flavobacterium pallidum]AWI26415.1 AI-2E family transporter [Flavobacterium pallidum]